VCSPGLSSRSSTRVRTPWSRHRCPGRRRGSAVRRQASRPAVDWSGEPRPRSSIWIRGPTSRAGAPGRCPSTGVRQAMVEGVAAPLGHRADGDPVDVRGQNRPLGGDAALLVPGVLPVADQLQPARPGRLHAGPGDRLPVHDYCLVQLPGRGRSGRAGPAASRSAGRSPRPRSARRPTGPAGCRSAVLPPPPRPPPRPRGPVRGRSCPPGQHYDPVSSQHLSLPPDPLGAVVTLCDRQRGWRHNGRTSSSPQGVRRSSTNRHGQQSLRISVLAGQSRARREVRRSRTWRSSSSSTSTSSPKLRRP
jgi:hypothetical protein